MSSSVISFQFAVHPVGARRVVITDAKGLEFASVEVPEGYEIRVVPAPWWRRLVVWVRLRAWRLRIAWGSP